MEDDTCSTDGGENCCDGLVCQPGSFEGTSVCTPICIEDNDECGTPQMYQCCNSNSVCDDTGKCTPST